MAFLVRLRSLVRNLVRGTRVDRELDAELRGYVDLLTDETVARGVPVEQARRDARIEVGGIEAVKQEVRSIRTGALLEQAVQDVRYALRGLRRAPVSALMNPVRQAARDVNPDLAVYNAMALREYVDRSLARAWLPVSW